MGNSLTRYLIVGPARSGTTVTHLCLAGHPNVSAVTDEVRVEPFFTQGLSTFTHGNDQPGEKKKAFLTLFDALTSLHRNEETTTLGFKTAISSSAEARKFCVSMVENFPKVKIVLTIRDDIVAQYGSLMRAKATGHWHSWVKPGKSLNEKLRLDEKRLRNHVIDYLKTVAELRRLKVSHNLFEISFEKDILSGKHAIYHRLFHFLDLPDTEIDWLRSEKVAPAPQEFIADYDRHEATVREIKKHLENDPDLLETSQAQTSLGEGLIERINRKLFNK